MTSAASLPPLAALFTWHIPIPEHAAFSQAQEDREAHAQGVHSNLDSPQGRASALIMSSPVPSAPSVRAFLAREGESLDPLVVAALHHRAALSTLEAPRTGRRAPKTAPAEALEHVGVALELVEREVLILAEERGVPEERAHEELPAEIFAALTVTYVRACLTAGDQGAAWEAMRELVARSPRIATPHIRLHAHLSAAIGYLAAGEPDEALIPAERARVMSTGLGFEEGVWRAARIRALALTKSGRTRASTAAHLDVVQRASRMSEDLLTPCSIRAEVILSELESRAILARGSLTRGEYRAADDEARAMLHRIQISRALRDGDEVMLWKREVDARILRMIVAGNPSSPLGEYDDRRREARLTIAGAPETEREQAIRFNTDADEQHARILASRGEKNQALRMYRRVLQAWQSAGDERAVERVRAEIERLHS